MSTLSTPDCTFTAPRAVNKNEVAFDLTKRRHGTCKFFNSQKGFGFINDQDPEQLGNQEVFVHYSAITAKGGFRSLAEGEEVEYLLQPGAKGFQAVEVSGPRGVPVQGDPKAKLPKSSPAVGYPAVVGMFPYMEGRGPLFTDPYLGYSVPYIGTPMLYPTIANAHYSPLGSSPVVQMPALRSPVQPYGHQAAMPLSPHMMGAYPGFSNVAIGQDGIRSPALNNGSMGGSGAFSTQGFAIPQSGLGIRSEAGRIGGERMRDEGRPGARAGDGSGFATISPNPLLYPPGGQSGGY